MKYIAHTLVLVVLIGATLADKAEKKEGMVASSYGPPPSPSYAAAPSSSYAAPPCPKNYLFSCQPNVAPVPCSPGYSGAYSENVPQYMLPPQYVLPQYPGLTQY